jgi:hypothetical protein
MIRPRHTGFLLCLAACVGSAPKTSPDEKAAEVRAYLSSIAPILVSRTLSADEQAVIDEAARGSDPQTAIDTILAGWAEDPALAEAAREMIQTRLSVSGASAEINFELPGNLAAYTVANRLPWSTLVTADYCVGDDLGQIDCDSGAPFAAGILTTRAFLKARASRFNLTRASTMMNTFACKKYPLADDLEPRIPRERLRTMFKADSPEEQEDPQAAGAFGNGFACYTCHGQFAWHAQLFVQFDDQGLYRADATGLQDPDGELGRSLGGLFASHLEDPEEAKVPASQMLGQPVADLEEAGAVLATSPALASCTTQGVLEYVLGLEQGSEIEPSLIGEIASQLAPAEATFADYAISVFTNRRVIDAVMQSFHAAAPPAEDTTPAGEDQP